MLGRTEKTLLSPFPAGESVLGAAPGTRNCLVRGIGHRRKSQGGGPVDQETGSLEGHSIHDAV